MQADELMRKMWDEDVVGLADKNKPFTAEEVLAVLKVAESRRYVNGRYEVVIPWKNDNRRYIVTERLLKTDSTLLRNTFSEGLTLVRNTARR